MSNFIDLGLVFVGDVVEVGGLTIRVVEVQAVQYPVTCQVTLVGEGITYRGYSDEQVELVEQGEYSRLAGVPFTPEFDWLNATDEELAAELDREEAEEWANGWDGEPELSEYEQGWANIRAEERAAVARQNLEDEAWANRLAPPSYQGVVGSREPDGGWIFEP